MSRPSPHSPHSQSFLSPTTSGNDSVFTLVPELISANAARLDALSQQNSGTALDISALHSLGDVPFAGPSVTLQPLLYSANMSMWLS